MNARHTGNNDVGKFIMIYLKMLFLLIHSFRFMF